MPVGITDHGNMRNAYRMYIAAYYWRQAHHRHRSLCDPGSRRQDKSRVHWGTEAQRRDDVSGGGLITHLTMGPKTTKAWSTSSKPRPWPTSKVASCSYPRMDKEVLATYSKGVIASSGLPSGIIQTRLRLGQF